MAAPAILSDQLTERETNVLEMIFDWWSRRLEQYKEQLETSQVTSEQVWTELSRLLVLM